MDRDHLVDKVLRDVFGPPSRRALAKERAEELAEMVCSAPIEQVYLWAAAFFVAKGWYEDATDDLAKIAGALDFDPDLLDDNSADELVRRIEALKRVEG